MYGDWVPDGPPGPSERAIGAWLKRRKPDGIVVATKGAGADLRARDYSSRVNPEAIAKDLGESLDHLGLSTIGLYWLHADDPQAPVAGIIDALLAHQAAGRIRYFGASNWTPERITEANAYAASQGRQGFVAIQPSWGLALPNKEKADAQGYQLHYEGRYEPLHAAGLAIIPYGSQSGGYFTKVEASGVDGVRKDLRERYDNPANVGRFNAAQTLARKHGVSINEIALAYLTSQPLQTIPIIGGTRLEQLEESVKAVDLKLTPAELEQLRQGL
jgi:aryl-alcohol dehydrogenase-like predicted oxidoreductase